MDKKIKRWIWIVWVLIILSLVLGFLFLDATANSSIKKPAIYLYPEEDMDVKVDVLVNGKLTKTIPEYGEGWNVFATREGIINGEYDYLFYEADLNELYLPEEGWIIASENLEDWFDENLPLLGLNEKEIRQFKEYWVERFKKNKYYKIKLLSDDYYSENLRLKINPTPDTLIRLNFHFEEIDEFEEIESPVILTPERNGFVAVEWGGILE